MIYDHVLFLSLWGMAAKVVAPRGRSPEFRADTEGPPAGAQPVEPLPEMWPHGLDLVYDGLRSCAVSTTAVLSCSAATLTARCRLCSPVRDGRLRQRAELRPPRCTDYSQLQHKCKYQLF